MKRTFAALVLACAMISPSWIGASVQNEAAIDTDLPPGVQLALARAAGEHVSYDGEMLVDHSWLSDSLLAFATVDGDGEPVRQVLDLRDGSISSMALEEWPESERSWPRGVDIGGPVGPNVPTSPDGELGIVRDGYNLKLVNLGTGAEAALTTDGQPDYAYGDGILLAWSGQVAIQREDFNVPPSVLWSPDNRHVLTFAANTRGVRVKTHVAPSAAPGGAPDMTSYAIRHAMAGDEHLTQADFVVIDTQSGRMTPLAIPEPYHRGADPLRAGYASWTSSGDHLYISYGNISETEYNIYRIDARMGTATSIYGESGHFRGHWREIPPAHVSNGRLALVSDRDGYRHLYTIDAEDGGDLQKITSGELYIARMFGIEDGWAYFTASQVDNSTDPYRYHLFRARMDGSVQEILTDHLVHVSNVVASPDMRHFLIEEQRLDAPNAHLVIDNSGSVVRRLTMPRLRPGEQSIERVSAVTRDPENPVWASIHRPTDFDPSRTYPVIHHVHGTVGFLWASMGHDRRAASRQEFADLGFIVIATDGMGNVGRTRSFLEAAHSAGHQCGGTEDSVMLLRELAADRSYIDLDRVGVYGFSQGGNCASRAILEFPNDIHVSVSGAGNHDARYTHPAEIYGYIGGGPDEFPERYDAQDNASLAHQLQGKLLFVHGGIDDDVPLMGTFHLINALIEHNRQYDLVVLPDYRHDAWTSPYYDRVVWSYFLNELKGEDVDLFSN
ncbi:prolyl oligopeptidase family serine peptidase [Parasphingopyxis sp.]|uniref:S9 family peptidase n=1 Tax=Parasphingopyxis sp. TaxID=1920299 RepID=UPI00262E0484|nr:prolyl oligopeptidase family serine peptidase [Parasphingopyxis sp.]